MSETGKNGERPNPPDLIPVSPKDFPELFEEGAQSFASAIFWTQDQKQVVHSEITFFTPAKKTFQVAKPADFNSGEFATALAQTRDLSCIFSISLVHANIFFKCLFVGTTENDIHFQLPEKIFKVQRRKNPRFLIPHGYVMKVTFEDPLNNTARITRKIWDISAGGLAFTVAAGDQPVFPDGLQLKEMSFVLQGRTIFVDAEVRHTAFIHEGPRKGECKVGVLFSRISPADVQLISSHVLEESRKFYSRFV